MPIKTIQPNYYVVPCEIVAQAKVISDPNQRELPANFWTTGFSDLMGVNNFNLTFTLNSGIFRGIGDCTSIRRPTSWEGSLDLTRYITSANIGRETNTGITSLYRLINQGTPSNGYLFGSSGQFAWNTTVGILFKIFGNNKRWDIGIAGLVSNASLSVERDRVEENISIATHVSNGFVSGLF